jgi:hypothetical protein
VREGERAGTAAAGLSRGGGGGDEISLPAVEVYTGCFFTLGRSKRDENGFFFLFFARATWRLFLNL